MQTVKLMSCPLIVFINEVDNEPATKAVEVVLTYLKKNPSYGLSVQIESIEANKTDAKILLEASRFLFSIFLYTYVYIIILITVCNKYVASIERKQTPHLILDTTKSGVSSETVKSFTQALGLPTISASYGQEGDLRQWRDLDESKQKYLLQIMPPADIMPEAVRSIVKRLNITNGKCGV